MIFKSSGLCKLFKFSFYFVNQQRCVFGKFLLIQQKRLSHQLTASILARCDIDPKYYYKGRQNQCYQLQFNYFTVYRHCHKYSWILRTVLFCQELCHMEKGSPSSNYSHVFFLSVSLYIHTHMYYIHVMFIIHMYVICV